MIEAKITCVASHINLPDIGTQLTKGMQVYMPEAQFKASQDLQRAWRNGAVEIKLVTRYREMRPASPVANMREVLNPIFPTPPGMGPSPTPVREPVPETVIFDPREISESVVSAINTDILTREKIRAELTQQLGVLEDRLAAKVAAQVMAQVAPLIQTVLQAVAKLETQGVSVGSPTFLGGPLLTPQGNTSVVADDDVPVFIPSRIGDQGLKGSIAVQSEASGGGAGVEDAAEAFKRLKRRKEKP